MDEERQKQGKGSKGKRERGRQEKEKKSRKGGEGEQGRERIEINRRKSKKKEKRKKYLLDNREVGIKDGTMKDREMLEDGGEIKGRRKGGDSARREGTRVIIAPNRRSIFN